MRSITLSYLGLMGLSAVRGRQQSIQKLVERKFVERNVTQLGEHKLDERKLDELKLDERS